MYTWHNIYRIIIYGIALMLPGTVAAQSGNWQEEARDLVKAEQYGQASAIYAGNCDSTHGLTRARVLSWWGGCLRHLGAYKEAERRYLESKEIYEEYDPELADRTRINLSILYNDMGRYDDAIAMLHAVTSIPFRQYASLCIAESLFRKGDSGTSIAICDSLLSLKELAPDLLPMLHNNRAYMLMERTDERSLNMACSDLEAAISMSDATKDEHYIALSNLAIVQARLNLFDKALAHIETAVDWFAERQKSNSDNYTDYRIALRKRAEIRMMSGRKAEALAAYKKYFAAERRYLQDNFAGFTEQNRLDMWKRERPLLSAIFAFEETAPDFLLDVALFRREVALLGGTPDNRSDSLKLVRKINRNLSYKGSDIRRSLSAGETALDFVKYEKKDRATNASVVWYGAIVIPPASSCRAVAFIPLFSESDLTGFRINNTCLNEAVCSPANARDKDSIYSSRLLAEMIWSPIKPHLKGTRDLYFAPEGMLHMLAIEYLYPLTDSLSTMQIHRITSPSQLIGRTGTATKRGQKLWAVGGLNYNHVATPVDTDTVVNHDAMDYLTGFFSGRYNFFSYLPGSKREVIAIDSICDSADTAFVATEEMFKRTICGKNYQRVHLATHAYALQVSGATLPYAMLDSITEDRSLLASGIALTGANKAYQYTNSEDGIISAREFCSLDLRDVDLMVISACQSAQGVANDEGPAGLVRGLKKAGVQSIVATLWEVDDNATQIFMRAFYASLHGGHGKRQALTDGQNALKNYSITRKRRRFEASRLASKYVEETITPYTSPYYWAPFILIDN